MLKACLNGPRMPTEHPALPVTPAQLADDVVAVTGAGAEMVHVHQKDASGRDTFRADAVAQTLEAIRAASPGTPVGITTGAWAAPGVEDRLAAIGSWTVLPDFASVNWHEDGAEQVADALLGRGVGVEAGLWTEAALQAWLAWPSRDRCVRVLLELPDEPDAARCLHLADRMLAILDDAANAVPVLLHGEDRSAWPVLVHARRLGLATRIGLEDTLTLPDGARAPDNASLIRAALART
ncbi:3-keto-5-aminohexanoate cleavage protein [Nocardioides sp. zg-1228]|uniref:3-keto-5-aminohexanoate cleavage protein n=1 Tax=Nocardioides sp. zg-1228 TaxID=2763008 RepID=UPI001642A8E6|nr:3-keto-5-aminohexanoate cleavage protein [Nocardioides sp. zg-1228]MBC2932703.1 3-keto-5-aminohexanoate cleavage protein [Nocardioides sp. zg-1228]QSF58182.1 3-keto-5-aminohexanoate cleavage protein [Nocardioides sp. zg-1228]